MIDQSPEGILLVNKKIGLTSFDIVAKVRGILKCKRVGHAGTLDPLATGLLLVLVGRYTKLSDYLTSDSKTYFATVTFGKSTTTDDAEGETLTVGDPNEISQTELEEQLKQFLGEQQQVPPLFSAISVKGERSYKRARREEDFSLPPRNILIHSIKLVSWNNPHAIIEVNSSKGTYIRSIARDLGEKIGVPAYLSQLKRTSSGSYQINDAIETDDLTDLALVEKSLIKGPDAILGIDKINLDENTAHTLKLGKRPSSPGPDTEKVLLAHCGETLIALAKRQEGRLVSVRGL